MDLLQGSSGKFAGDRTSHPQEDGIVPVRRKWILRGWRPIPATEYRLSKSTAERRYGAVETWGGITMRMTTLCYIEQDGKYLMLHRTKKKKDINKDKWIGVGGHAEEGEGPEECLLREVKEETGLTLTSYRFRGLITFISNECEPELMCLFTADGFTGELITCNEGDLVWVDKTQVPELPTWSGDAIFLKQILSDDPRFFTLLPLF